MNEHSRFDVEVEPLPGDVRISAQVEFNEVEMTRMLDQIENALRERKASVFQRNGKLVHTFRVNRPPEDDDVIKRPAGALGIHEMTPLQLRECMSNFIQFYKKLVKDKKFVKVEIPVPMIAVRHTAERAEHWYWRELIGIIETPLMRPNGSIITEDGYDSATGLLLDKGGIEYPPIPLTPTKQQCLEALEVLKKPFAKFPFVPDDASIPLGTAAAEAAPSASRSVVLSGVLTALVRHLLRAAPMHGISAPEVGSGKSYIADAIAIIATGRDAATLAFTGDEAEDRKCLVGALLQGDTILSYDNVESEMFGAFICSVLTQELVQVRILRSTGQHTVKTGITLCANGNSLMLAGDLADRAIVCKIDAGMDKPGERKFDGDFHEEMRANRPALVAAALTLLRGYITAGKPWPKDTKQSLGFKHWDRLVRGCLLWLGEPDPYETKAFITATELGARESRNGLVEAIVGLIGVGKPFAANDLLKFRFNNENAEAGRVMEEALRSVVPPGSNKAPSLQAVSKYLQRSRDRIIAGHVLRGAKDSHTEAWGFTLEVARPVDPRGQGEMAL